MATAEAPAPPNPTIPTPTPAVAGSEATPPEGLYEVVGGEVREKPAMGAYEVWLASALFRAIVTTPGVDDLGWVVSEGLFHLGSSPGSKNDRRPDLAFVAFDRWPRDRPIPSTAAWDVVPDLAVEVISPTNRSVDDLAKVVDYFQAGVRAVWEVFPTPGMVRVWHALTSAHVLTRDDTLDGGATLPGFRLPLANLFPAPKA